MQGKSGSYTIVRPYARGGMAEILLAQTHDGRSVIIKRAVPEMALDRRFVDGFLREAALARILEHENIVRVLDVGSERGLPFIVLELVEGHDLALHIAAHSQRGDRMPADAAVQLVSDVCEALHYAHERLDAEHRPLGIVHRDVSPSNVMVASDGKAMLFDFGIAKATAATRDKETTAGIIKGKLSYLAPELLEGKKAERSVDLFALGTVCFELLTSVNPFMADTDFNTLLRIARVQVDWALVPSWAEPTLRRALALQPSDRFANALELKAALLEAARREGIMPSRAAVTAWSQSLATEVNELKLLRDEQRRQSDPRIELTDASLDPLFVSTRDRSSLPKRRVALVGVAATVLSLTVAAGVWSLRPVATAGAAAAPSVEAAVAVVPSDTSSPPTAVAVLPSDPQPQKPAKSPVKTARARTPEKARVDTPAPQPVVAASPPKTGNGKLRVVVMGQFWGRVEVDGKPYGHTPLPAIQLSAGAHQVRVENSDIKREVDKTVMVLADRTEVLEIDFSAEP